MLQLERKIDGREEGKDMERRTLVNKTNADFEGGMEHMWIGIKGIPRANKQERLTRE